MSARTLNENVAEKDLTPAEVKRHNRKRLRDEDKLAARIRRQSLADAAQGFVWLLVGTAGAVFSVLTQKPYGASALAGAAIFYGAFRLLVGLFHSFYAYPLMSEALGEEAAERFRSTATGNWAVAKVGSLAIVITLCMVTGLGLASDVGKTATPVIRPTAATTQVAPVALPPPRSANTTTTPTAVSSSVVADVIVKPAPQAQTKPALAKTVAATVATPEPVNPPAEAPVAVLLAPVVPVAPVITPTPTPTPTPSPTPVPAPTTATVCGVPSIALYGSAIGSVSGLVATTNAVSGAVSYVLTLVYRNTTYIYNVTSATTVYGATCAPLNPSLLALNDAVSVYMVPDADPATVHVPGEILQALIVVDASR